MPTPMERRRHEINAEGAKLKFVLNAAGEIEIMGNRKGLTALAAICNGLVEAETYDHYHLDDAFWGTEAGSLAATLYRIETL
jgi:hypothetical protein